MINSESPPGETMSNIISRQQAEEFFRFARAVMTGRDWDRVEGYYDFVANYFNAEINALENHYVSEGSHVRLWCMENMVTFFDYAKWSRDHGFRP